MKKSLNSLFKKATLNSNVLFRSTIIASVTLSTLFLSACSDSNDNNDIEDTNSVIGVWFGQATTFEDEQESVVIAVSPDGTAILYASGSGNMFITNGTLSTDGVTSDDVMYYPKDGMTRNGPLQASAQGDTLEGVGFNDTIEFSASRIASQYEVTLEDIAGNYSQSFSGSSYMLSFAIDSDGLLSGSNTIGCVYSGYVEPIANVNGLFDITIQVDSCFENFEYNGLLAYGVFPFEYEGGVNDRSGIVIATEHSSRAYEFKLFSPQN